MKKKEKSRRLEPPSKDVIFCDEEIGVFMEKNAHTSFLIHTSMYDERWMERFGSKFIFFTLQLVYLVWISISIVIREIPEI